MACMICAPVIQAPPLELDDNLTLLQAHTISDEVEALLLDAYPDAEVIIHEDPASLKEPTPEFAS